jgi:transposase
LLSNLSDALDTYFKSISGTINRLVKAKTSELLNIYETESMNILTAEEQINNVRIDPRLARFNKVKELQANGVPILRISKYLGMSRNTVQSYFVQESLSPRVYPKSTNIELFTNHIVARLNVRGHKLKDIFEEICELGFNGSRSQAYYNINVMKKTYGINTPGFLQFQNNKIPYIKPLSTRKLAKYIGSHFTDISDPRERNYMEILLKNVPELRIVRKLVQIFKTMLVRGFGNIRRWIDFVKSSKYKLSGLKTFARGLLKDIKAVENGIRMPWSNGAVEGNINRIKSIKRRMYGRASFDLLRKKVILSQTG